jgi:hypothetical protein
VLGKQALDEIPPGGGEIHDDDAPVGGVPATADELAALQRGGDLGGVRLGPAEPAPQRAQLERAARRGQHDQHREASRRDALPTQLGGEPAAHGRLGAQQRLQRTVRERIAELQRHPGGTVGGDPDGATGRAAQRTERFE